jgi:CubicO group peptidase (beta-lactamase class C family)
LIGMLVAEGKLSWDSKPQDIWPELAAKLDPDYRAITLRMLLQHRAGIPAYTAGAEYTKLPDFAGDSSARRKAFAEYVLSRRPAGKTGEYLYSNAGYGIAAGMAEAAAGESYGSLLQSRVFDPLGIKAHWGWPLKAGPDEPWGHSAGLFGLTAHDPSDGYELDDFVAPAGDLSFSLGDYAKFVQAHLRGQRGLDPVPGEAADGCSAELVKDLHVPVEDYSCGWAEQSFQGHPASAHEGSVGTFHAITVIVPELDRAAVVITNAGGDRQSGAIRKLLFELLAEDWD